jgi:hypothetical protein
VGRVREFSLQRRRFFKSNKLSKPRGNDKAQKQGTYLKRDQPSSEGVKIEENI